MNWETINTNSVTSTNIDFDETILQFNLIFMSNDCL